LETQGVGRKEKAQTLSLLPELWGQIILSAYYTQFNAWKPSKVFVLLLYTALLVYLCLSFG